MVLAGMKRIRRDRHLVSWHHFAIGIGEADGTLELAIDQNVHHGI